MLWVTYYLHESGNYHVRMPVMEQEISVWRETFCRVLGVSRRAVAGCRDITVAQAVELGFILPLSLRRKAL